MIRWVRVGVFEEMTPLVTGAVCSFSSMASLMPFSITVAMIFPRIDSKVMPLQSEHSLTSPFFGKGMIIPSLHSFVIFPSVQTLLQSIVSCSSITSPPCFIISGLILSFPAACPFSGF